MPRPALRNLFRLVGFFLLAWAGVRYLLPIAMPFLMGTALALAAEPMARPLTQRLRFPRPLAALLSVSAALILLCALLVLLLSLAVRELGALAGALPDLGNTARQGLLLLEDFLMGIVARTPEGVRPVLTQGVLRLFGSGNTLMNRLLGIVSSVASGILLGIPDGALGVGTGILSAYMISSRLPKIREFLRTRLPEPLYTRYLPAWKRMKTAIFGWLKAQLKLSGISCGILIVGFLLLRIPYAPLWGVLTAFVDALPLLGTGAVLLPWALVCVLQGNSLLAVGLVGIYAATALTRSALEPRLVGKQLGIDPLLTLVALYFGYQIWGIWGMLLSPVLAVIAGELAAAGG